MHLILAPALLAITALAVSADVSETPIPDGPPMAVEEILADIPDAAPAAVTQTVPPEGEIIPVQAPDTATAIPAAEPATEAPPAAQPEIPAPTTPGTEATAPATPGTEATAQAPATPERPAAEQDGTQAEVGSQGAVATPVTQPAPGQDGTAAVNAGTTGWTGGTGGAQLGTTPAGALPESKTWQPPVATGIDLKGNASS